MLKLSYKPVDLIAGMIGGLLAGLVFKRVWQLMGRGDAPKPTDERRGEGEILLAATVQDAIFAVVKADARPRGRGGDAQADRDLARQRRPAAWQVGLTIIGPPHLSPAGRGAAR